jgi:hypothetical protein
MALDIDTWEIVAGDDETTIYDFESDVSAYTFTCQVRESRGDTGNAIVTATCTPVTDTCTVTLTDTQTRALADRGRRRYWADLQQDNGTTRTTLFYISIVVQDDVSR